MKTFRLSRAAALAAALASIAGSAPVARATSSFTWDVRTIDPSQYFAWDASIAIAPDGTVHIADWTGGFGLRYGADTGSGFAFDSVLGAVTPPLTTQSVAPPDATNLLYVTTEHLAVGPDGTPWLAHALLDSNDGGGYGLLRVRHLVDGAWTSESLEPTNMRPAIAVDATGAVHLAWINHGLRYARRAPTGGWTFTDLWPATWQPSIAIGPDGTPHIVVVESNGTVRHFVKPPGSPWTNDVVAGPDWGVPAQADVALDAFGRPRVIYTERNPLADWDAPNRLHYVRNDGAGWQREPIDVGSTMKAYPALAIDPAGNPLVAWQRWHDYDLVVSTRNGGTWSNETVDAAGEAGHGIDAAFDATGAPWVVTSTGGSGLRLAKGQRVVDAPSPPEVVPSRRLGSASPLPARSGADVSLAVQAAEAGTLELSAYDARGTLRARATHAVTGGWNVVRTSTRGLAPGIYWLRVADGAGRADARRIVVTD